VEHPQRSLYLGRIYDIPVIMNAVFPGLIDRFSGLFVRFHRRKELSGKQRAVVSNQRPLFTGRYLAMFSLGVLAIGWLLRKKL
jgi:hypothetical protein